MPQKYSSALGIAVHAIPAHGLKNVRQSVYKRANRILIYLMHGPCLLDCSSALEIAVQNDVSDPTETQLTVV